MSPVNIDRYELCETLGQGATGAAYRAFDPRLKREVVVKRFATAGGDDLGRLRFVREARALVALHHPGIIEIYDFGTEPDGTPYLVTEYVRGVDLAQLLKRHGVFDEPVLLAVGLELCGALAHAHEHGIVHRAVKLESILVDRGRLVLTDFGMARDFAQAGATLDPDTHDTTIKAEALSGFVSPEQLEQRQVDGRADVFAIGALLYFLATNTLPYRAANIQGWREQFRLGKPQDLQTLRTELSKNLVALIHRCLNPRPENRPQSAAILRLALQRLLEYRGYHDAREILSVYASDPSQASLLGSVPGDHAGFVGHEGLGGRSHPRRIWLWTALVGAAVTALITGLLLNARRNAEAITPAHVERHALPN